MQQITQKTTANRPNKNKIKKKKKSLQSHLSRISDDNRKKRIGMQDYSIKFSKLFSGKYCYLLLLIICFCQSLRILYPATAFINIPMTTTKHVNISNSMTLSQPYDFFKLAEEYYWRSKYYEIQFDSKHMRDLWVFNEPRWPCLYGTYHLDGSKYFCGLALLNAQNRKCIIYSFGSNNQWEFERAILKYTENCEIHTFDPWSSNRGMPVDDRQHFYPWGISNAGRVNMNSEKANSDGYANRFSLTEIMSKLGHLYIDYMKIDCEGCEWQVFDSMDSQLLKWPFIGQIQIEIHPIAHFRVNYIDHRMEWKKEEEARTKQALFWLITLLENRGFRMHHRDVLSVDHPSYLDCAEYSFIYKDWRPEIKQFDEIKAKDVLSESIWQRKSNKILCEYLRVNNTNC